MVLNSRGPRGTGAPNRTLGCTPMPRARNQRSHDDGAQRDQVNRPAATGVRQIEGPYRRVRLNAWLGPGVEERELRLRQQRLQASPTISWPTLVQMMSDRQAK